MAQILTTIEDNSLVAPLLSVIKKLRGVTRTSVYEGEVSELSKESLLFISTILHGFSD